MTCHSTPWLCVTTSISKAATMESLLACPVCFETFDSDLSLLESESERRDSHLPVLSHQCTHKICASCLNDWQRGSVSKRAKKLPKWFKCPCCAKRTAFDAEEMEIDTFACTMFAHVKANGGLIAQSSAETLKEADGTQSPEYFLENGSARRTEFYYQQNSTPISEDVDSLRLPVQRRLRSRPGPSRRDKIVMAALSDGKDTEEIKAVLDREDAMVSTEEFLLRGASRRCSKLSPVHSDDPSCIDRPAAPLEEISGGTWKCVCGVINSPTRKRCPAPCYKWRPGLRTGGKKFDEDDELEGTNEGDAGGDEDRWECPSCKQVGPFDFTSMQLQYTKACAAFCNSRLPGVLARKPIQLYVYRALSQLNNRTECAV